MIPRIQTTSDKKLVGKRLTMSLTDYSVATLWGSFMPARKHIPHTVGNNLFSIAIYPPHYFTQFHPDTDFERWAAVEVAHIEHIPDGMETLVLQGGLYAIFDYKGPSGDPAVYQYILNTWLPASGYGLDNRPHVEVLGDHYKPHDPSSEEEIWVPIQPKYFVNG